MDKLPLKNEADGFQEPWKHHSPHNEDIPIPLPEEGKGHRYPKDDTGNLFLFNLRLMPLHTVLQLCSLGAGSPSILKGQACTHAPPVPIYKPSQSDRVLGHAECSFSPPTYTARTEVATE